MQKSNLDVTNNSELEKCSCFETFVPLQLLLQAQLSWLMFDLGCDSVFVNFNSLHARSFVCLLLLQ